MKNEISNLASSMKAEIPVNQKFNSQYSPILRESALRCFSFNDYGIFVGGI